MGFCRPLTMSRSSGVIVLRSCVGTVSRGSEKPYEYFPIALFELLIDEERDG
jgi:hypothetical protein